MLETLIHFTILFGAVAAITAAFAGPKCGIGLGIFAVIAVASPYSFAYIEKYVIQGYRFNAIETILFILVAAAIVGWVLEIKRNNRLARGLDEVADHNADHAHCLEYQHTRINQISKVAYAWASYLEDLALAQRVTELLLSCKGEVWESEFHLAGKVNDFHVAMWESSIPKRCTEQWEYPETEFSQRVIAWNQTEKNVVADDEDGPW